MFIWLDIDIATLIESVHAQSRNVQVYRHYEINYTYQGLLQTMKLQACQISINAVRDPPINEGLYMLELRLNLFDL